MKSHIPHWTFIFAAIFMVLATKSIWALPATWALCRFAQKLAENLHHDPETIQ